MVIVVRTSMHTSAGGTANLDVRMSIWRRENYKTLHYMPVFRLDSVIFYRYIERASGRASNYTIISCTAIAPVGNRPV